MTTTGTTTPDDRPVPPMTADERTTLESWLDFHRATLAAKCAGLDDAEARTLSAAPSPSPCSAWSSTWRRWNGPGSAAYSQAPTCRPYAAPPSTPRRPTAASHPRRRHPRRNAGPLAGRGPRLTDGRRAPPPRHHRRLPGHPRLPPLDLRPHDRGIRPPQRPRRPDPGTDRRSDGRMRRGGATRPRAHTRRSCPPYPAALPSTGRARPAALSPARIRRHRPLAGARAGHAGRGR